MDGIFRAVYIALPWLAGVFVLIRYGGAAMKWFYGAHKAKAELEQVREQQRIKRLTDETADNAFIIRTWAASVKATCTSEEQKIITFSEEWIRENFRDAARDERGVIAAVYLLEKEGKARKAFPDSWYID